MDRKNITFIIIAYNEENTIPLCIKSIIDQTYKAKISILVINDASKDNTLSVLEKLSRQYAFISVKTNTTNKGRGYSRKLGVDSSKTDLVAFVDADIILPNNWLSECMESIQDFDAVGGIAMPDGDVQYVYTRYNLKPKLTPHTVEVTGSNGLYKKTIFETINFSPTMENGEDVDLIWKLKKGGFKLHTIKGLISIHREDRNFIQSIKWLFESGIGASLLFNKYNNIRLPDLVFFSFIVIILISIVISVYYYLLLPLFIPFIFLILVSLIHLYKKFELSFLPTHLAATLINSLLIGAYLSGRFIGIFKIK